MAVKIAIAYKKDTKEIKGIMQVENGLKCDCVCIGCLSSLIARANIKGKIYKMPAHFAHESTTECKNGLKSILYELTKKIIKESNEIYIPLFKEYIEYKDYDILDDLFEKKHNIYFGEDFFEITNFSTSDYGINQRYPDLIIDCMIYGKKKQVKVEILLNKTLDKKNKIPYLIENIKNGDCNYIRIDMLSIIEQINKTAEEDENFVFEEAYLKKILKENLNRYSWIMINKNNMLYDRYVQMDSIFKNKLNKRNNDIKKMQESIIKEFSGKEIIIPTPKKEILKKDISGIIHKKMITNDKKDYYIFKTKNIKFDKKEMSVLFEKGFKINFYFKNNKQDLPKTLDNKMLFKIKDFTDLNYNLLFKDIEPIWFFNVKEYKAKNELDKELEYINKNIIEINRKIREKNKEEKRKELEIINNKLLKEQLEKEKKLKKEEELRRIRKESGLDKIINDIRFSCKTNEKKIEQKIYILKQTDPDNNFIKYMGLCKNRLNELGVTDLNIIRAFLVENNLFIY